MPMRAPGDAIILASLPVNEQLPATREFDLEEPLYDAEELLGVVLLTRKHPTTCSRSSHASPTDPLSWPSRTTFEIARRCAANVSIHWHRCGLMGKYGRDHPPGGRHKARSLFILCDHKATSVLFPATTPPA